MPRSGNLMKLMPAAAAWASKVSPLWNSMPWRMLNRQWAGSPSTASQLSAERPRSLAAAGDALGQRFGKAVSEMLPSRPGVAVHIIQVLLFRKGNDGQRPADFRGRRRRGGIGCLGNRSCRRLGSSRLCCRLVGWCGRPAAGHGHQDHNEQSGKPPSPGARKGPNSGHAHSLFLCVFFRYGIVDAKSADASFHRGLS